MRPDRSGKAFAEGRRLAKRLPDAPQRGPSFPGLCGQPRSAKSRWIPAAFLAFQSSVRRSEPLRTAPARPAVAVVAIPVEAAVPAAIVTVHAAMAPAALAEAVSHVGENGEAAPLAVVDGAVEGIRP